MKHDEIISVLRDLHKTTGFRMSLHDSTLNEIAAYPESRLPFCAFVHKNKSEYETCKMCDINAFALAEGRQNSYIYKCRYGLTEAISPLYNFGTLTGFLMMGQVIDEGVSEESLAKQIRHLASSDSEAEEITRTVPRVSHEMIESYVRIMTLCARYLTLSNAIQSKKPTICEAARKYISEHFSEKISIKELCRELDCSKSSLLSIFKRQCGMTVGEFITATRLMEAKRLLEEGALNINEIAHKTGFYDQSYFSKVFSAEFGMSPSEYRRTARISDGEEH